MKSSATLCAKIHELVEEYRQAGRPEEGPVLVSISDRMSDALIALWDNKR